MNDFDCTILAWGSNSSFVSSHQDDQPTKEDYAVAKFLRFNVPTREAKLHNMEVHCFFGETDQPALWQADRQTDTKMDRQTDGQDLHLSA